jgi:hypothetical protein
MNQINHKFELLEPSLADAISLIKNDTSLGPAKKTQWLCSIRRIARCIDRPLEMLPARIMALRHPVGRLNAARLGISQKTLANHKSNLKAALNHLSNHGVTSFIELYIRDFRPVLLRGSNAPLLFPGGKGDGHTKCASTLSDQITKRIEKELGFRITAHQFRHAAAAIILKNEPGNYELVRRILGHRNVQTTINFYVGLETMESSKQFGEMIMEHASNDPKKK